MPDFTMPSEHDERTGACTQWLHQLRNEVNTVTMTNAAATGLLKAGDIDGAIENLQRAADACKRCAAMLALSLDFRSPSP